MSDDQTEAPSEQKIKKARDKGQIPRAREMISAFVLIVCVTYYSFTISSLYQIINEVFETSFVFTRADLESPLKNLALTGEFFRLMMQFFLPLLFLKLIAAFLGSTLIGGVSFNFSKLAPDFSKVNPVGGLKKIFSKNSLVEFIKNVIKISLFFACLYLIIANNVLEISTMVRSSFNGVIALFTKYMTELLIMLVALTVVFSFADAPYQIMTFMKQMKMSKQELKDEYKESEGNPETKGKLKQVRTQMTKSSVAKKVPEADLVIMNPTHFAVALKYDLAKADAPFVVAKGTDEMALYIKGLAKKNLVEVIESPEIARSIYHTTQLNQMIPSQLYECVGTLLHYVNDLKRYKNGLGRKPKLPSRFSIPEDFRF